MMKKLICAFSLSLALYSLLALLPVEATRVSRWRVVRFHVIANSDSSADQELKLAVRDEVLIISVGIGKCAGQKNSCQIIRADYHR